MISIEPGALPGWVRVLPLRGIRISLKWEEINFEEKATPSRFIVSQRVGSVKTEASGKSIPLDDTSISSYGQPNRTIIERVIRFGVPGPARFRSASCGEKCMKTKHFARQHMS